MAKAIIVAVALQQRNPPPHRWSYFAENPSPYLYGGKTGYNRKVNSFDSDDRIIESEREGEVSAIYDPIDYADNPLVDINLSDEQQQSHGEKQEEIISPSWSSDFEDQAVRADFLRKIHCIFCVQTLFCIAVTSTFLFTPVIKTWMNQNHIFLYCLMIFICVFVLLLYSNEWLRWKYKVNTTLLCILTVNEGVLVATASSVLDTNAILLATSIISIICLVFVVVLSIPSDPIDFTKPLIELLFTFLCLCTVISILIIAFLSFVSIMSIVVVVSGVFLFFIYFIVDMHNMMGVKNRHGLTIDNPVFAVLNLYIDVVHLIIFLISICYYGCCSRNDFIV